MGKEERASELAEYLKVPVAAPKMRIGLLGGSFNPAHEGHRHISLTAMKRLGLDRVWWLVSPGNPLKDTAKAPDIGQRVAAARQIARHPRIVVTGFEGARAEAGRIGVYTIDTLRFLKRRFLDVNFVWLMGADNLVSFHRWRAWEELFGLVPIAVLDRPGFRLKARASKAAERFAFAAVDESDAGLLARMVPPAWTMLTLPLSGVSSTALRGGKPRAEDGKGPARKAAKAEKQAVKARRAKVAKIMKKAVKQAKKDAKKSKKKTKRY
jgi:nicotinate-nucleotide adenylyltransferase